MYNVKVKPITNTWNLFVFRPQIALDSLPIKVSMFQCYHSFWIWQICFDLCGLLRGVNHGVLPFMTMWFHTWLERWFWIAHRTPSDLYLSIALIDTNPCIPLSWHYSTFAMTADLLCITRLFLFPLSIYVDVWLCQACTTVLSSVYLHFSWVCKWGCWLSLHLYFIWSSGITNADVDIYDIISTLWRNLKECSHIKPTPCLFFLLYIIYRSSWSWPLH